ncbi:MAG: signal peptidase II [Candidatus Binatia bacterium]
MSDRAAVVFIVAIVALDQLTKWVVSTSMTVGQSIDVIPAFFALTYVRNPGAAFGLLGNVGSWGAPLLVVVSVVAVAALSWLLHSVPAAHRWERAAAAAVIGGALGNLYDRIMLGEVVDFLDVYVGDWHWPAFNVADSAISVGVVVLILASFRAGDAGPAPAPGPAGLD